MNTQIMEESLKMFINSIEQVILLLGDFANTCIALSSNKRVIHLATHAKKKRVRKKNLKRIEKYFSDC